MCEQNRQAGAPDGSVLDLARRWLEAALDEGWLVAEVYAKEGKSLRCEFGPLGVRSVQSREETGFALRVWDGSGREGFAHADAPASRRASDLLSLARLSASRHPGGPVPRLPRDAGRAAPWLGGRTTERAAIHSPAEAEDPLRDLAHRIIGAFAAPGREATALHQGWVETGVARILVANSLGLSVGAATHLATADLVAQGSPTGQAPADAGPALRYRVVGEDFEGLDLDRLVSEAAWRAAAPIGGRSESGRGVVVALEPRGAAAWIRSLVPHFVGRGRFEQPRAPESRLEAAIGLDLVDDPQSDRGPRPAPFDGEGRPVSKRVLVEHGSVVGRFVDSRDQEAPEQEIGPMRRDSFRDLPSPGPVCLSVPAGSRSRVDMLKGMECGLLATSLTVLSRPGSDSFVAEAGGVWIERGLAHHSVGRTLLVIPALGALARVVERGSDVEFDGAGSPVVTPTLLIEGVDLLPMA